MHKNYIKYMKLPNFCSKIKKCTCKYMVMVQVFSFIAFFSMSLFLVSLTLLIHAYQLSPLYNSLLI